MKEVKGFTRTVGDSGVRPSSVRDRVRGGVQTGSLGGGLVTTGRGCIVGEEGEGQTRTSGGMHGTQWEGEHIGSTLDIGGAGVVGYGIGGYGQLAWQG